MAWFENVKKWLPSIVQFKALHTLSVFSCLNALDQHLAVSSCLVRSTETGRVVTATVAFVWCDWCDVILIIVHDTVVGVGMTGVIMEPNEGKGAVTG